MRGAAVMLTLLLLLLFTGACLAADWPVPQGDRCLTNRSAAKGDLTQAPRELWRVPTGVWSAEVEVVAGAVGDSTVTMSAMTAGPLPEGEGRVRGKGGKKRSRPQPDWRRLSLDVAGTGAPVTVPDGYWGKLIPGRRGLQRVAWTGTWGEGPERIQCFSYEEGLDHPRLEWETEPVTTVYSPQICLADVNGDGTTEVVSALHYRILIFDGATGERRASLRYHNLRNYGFFGVFWEPGDERAKFANISDFANHFDVINQVGDELLVAFRRDVGGTEAGGITRHTKIVRPGPNPLEDVDGDGHPELTFNFFNDRGDERWQVVSYEPLTGTLKHDLAGRYLVGMYDVDGCGRPELLCHTLRDRHITGWGEASVLKVEGGRVRTLFTQRGVRFATFDLRYLPPTVDTGAAGGKTTAAAGRLGPRGEPGFLLERPGRDRRAASLQAYLWGKAGFTPGWQVVAPAGGTLAVRAVEGRDYGFTLPAGRPARVALHVTAPAPGAQVALAGATGTLQSCSPQAPLAPRPIVVGEGKAAVLVTETGNETVAAYALGGAQPRRLWERRLWHVHR